MSGEQIKLTQFYDGAVTKPTDLGKKKEIKKDIKEKLEKALTGVTDYSKADFSKINVSRMSVDDLENLMKDVIKDKYKKSNKTEYKTALKEMEQQINALEKQRKDIAQTKVRVVAELAPENNKNVNIDSKNKMRKAVKDKLETQYENGEISKEVYKNAKSYGETNKIKHMFKSIGRVFSGKRADAYEHYETVINRNGYIAKPTFEAEQKTKLDAAKIDIKTLNDIKANYVGYDGELTYSYNGGDWLSAITKQNPQPGEKHFITTKLNTLAKDNGSNVKFEDEDTVEIMKSLGVKIEKNISFGKTAGDAVKTGTVGLAGTPLLTQNQTVKFDGIPIPAINNSQSLGIVIPLTATALGAANSMIAQHTRVEEKVMGMQLPDNIKTYSDFADYVENSTEIRKENKELLQKIGNFYQDKGNFLKDEFVKQGKIAAGHGDKKTPDASVLNSKELFGWLGQLEAGKIKVEIPKPVEEPKDNKEVTCDVKVKHFVEKEKVDDTHCEKVESWHRWWMYANKYNPKNSTERNEIIRYLKTKELEALQAKGLLLDKKPTDNFFPTVGTELCLPDKIPGKGNKTYQYDDTVVLKKPDKPEESVDPSKPQTTCASYSKQEADHRSTKDKTTLTLIDCNNKELGKVISTDNEIKDKKAIEDVIKDKGDANTKYRINHPILGNK